MWWIGVKWVPGGSAFFAAMVNSLIHVIMYSYYALAAAGGPAIQKYLGWKKYLTILQMAQFVSALVLGIRALIYGCDFPLWMQYALVVYMSSFLVLFGNYYRNAYILHQQQQQRNPSAINKNFSSIIKNGHGSTAVTASVDNGSSSSGHGRNKANNGSNGSKQSVARHNGHNGKVLTVHTHADNDVCDSEC